MEQWAWLITVSVFACCIFVYWCLWRVCVYSAREAGDSCITGDLACDTIIALVIWSFERVNFTSTMLVLEIGKLET